MHGLLRGLLDVVGLEGFDTGGAVGPVDVGALQDVAGGVDAGVGAEAGSEPFWRPMTRPAGSYAFAFDQTRTWLAAIDRRWP